MHSNHRARLAELERRAANAEPDAGNVWTQEQWQRRLYWALVYNELYFDARDHVAINLRGASELLYDFLGGMAAWINNAIAAEPGAVLCPLMPDQVELGLRVLDAGLIDPAMGAVPGASKLDGYCYGFGEPFFLGDLLTALRKALHVVNVQAPGLFSYSLEGLEEMLLWQKEQG